MIDEEATFKRYGYYARDLTPKSGKRILAACDGCGKIRDLRKDKYSALCNSCSKKGEKNPSWKGGKLTRICPICGKSFTVNIYKIKRGEGNYCSLQCHNESRYNQLTRICPICGKSFTVVPSQIKCGYGIFCSKQCAAKSRIGEKSPNWNGGISFEPYCEKFNDEFKCYIRVKFGGVCFLCGKTEQENGKKLSVHHTSYNKLCGCADTEGDRKADDKTCQFVPLCASCHAKVHGDRDKWEKFFMDKLHNKLNGWYI